MSLLISTNCQLIFSDLDDIISFINYYHPCDWQIINHGSQTIDIPLLLPVKHTHCRLAILYKTSEAALNDNYSCSHLMFFLLPEPILLLNLLYSCLFCIAEQEEKRTVATFPLLYISSVWNEACPVKALGKYLSNE